MVFYCCSYCINSGKLNTKQPYHHILGYITCLRLVQPLHRLKWISDGGGVELKRNVIVKYIADFEYQKALSVFTELLNY